LIGLLRPNTNERMSFNEFFNHPFLQQSPSASGGHSNNRNSNQHPKGSHWIDTTEDDAKPSNHVLPSKAVKFRN
jgi:hypothetical protein